MTTVSRSETIRDHKLEKARRANDRAATAILEADRTWTPDPETPPMLRLPLYAGLRWSVSAAA